MDMEKMHRFLTEITNYLEAHDINIDNINPLEIDENPNVFFYSDFFDFNYGATRGCFISTEEQLKYVFKFDLENVSENYCENEAYYYKKAKAAGLGECFAKVFKFDEVNNTSVYCAEYVDEIGCDSLNNLTKEEKEEVEKHTSQYKTAPRLPMEWSFTFINYYGTDLYDSLLEFLIDYGINDLHYGNIGYIQGRPVIFDYAGFWEDSFSSCY